jgi:hypothetical protein
MKLNKITFLLAAGAFAFATGCTSTPTKVDAGPVQARTFNFVTTDRPVPSYADNRQAVHTMIQDAITKNLESRGVKKTASGGDITVAYLVITGDNVSTTALNEYFGYRAEAMALHEKAQEAYTSTKNPNHFASGTLVIDLVDNKTFKLLKRGYATKPLLRDPSNEVRAGRIQEVVDEILRDARVGP